MEHRPDCKCTCWQTVLAVPLDNDFVRTMTDAQAGQLGVMLKDRARHELGLPRVDEELSS